MHLHTIAIAALILLFSAPAHAEGDPTSQLYNARSLKCHFGPGTATEWTGSKPKVSTARNDQDVQFDSIDLKNHTARVIGNAGAADVTALLTYVGISFIESAPAVIATTTVFQAPRLQDGFLAVDSRHALVLGTPLAQQYYGTCKIWQ